MNSEFTNEIKRNLKISRKNVSLYSLYKSSEDDEVTHFDSFDIIIKRKLDEIRQSRGTFEDSYTYSDVQANPHPIFIIKLPLLKKTLTKKTANPLISLKNFESCKKWFKLAKEYAYIGKISQSLSSLSQAYKLKQSTKYLVLQAFLELKDPKNLEIETFCGQRKSSSSKQQCLSILNKVKGLPRTIESL
jgi:hypothetical protein